MNHNNIFGNKHNNRLAELARRNLQSAKPQTDNSDLVITADMSTDAAELDSFAHSWEAVGFPYNKKVIAELQNHIYHDGFSADDCIELYQRHMTMSKIDAIILD